MARKIVIFQNFEKLSIFKFAYFYRLSNAKQFIAVSYWTFLALSFLILNLFVSGLD